jgi:hypothetical protein
MTQASKRARKKHHPEPTWVERLLSPIFWLIVVFRWLMPLLATGAAIMGLTSPSELRIADATRLDVMAEHVPPVYERKGFFDRGRSRMRMVTPGHIKWVSGAGQITTIPCSKTVICERIPEKATRALTVWVIDAGIVPVTWLVAANDRQKPLVTQAEQQALYSETRFSGGLAIFIVYFIGFFFWLPVWMRWRSRPRGTRMS